MSESAEANQAAAERRQQAIGVKSGAARAAVLGINDGLVTNTALILGVVGATDVVGVVQLTGLASLVAGTRAASNVTRSARGRGGQSWTVGSAARRNRARALRKT